jgi:DNA/RNA endonuclease G (NUC1)
MYSQEYKQPLWIRYRVEDKKDVVIGKIKFYNEVGIITSDNRDYYNNDYDKGHMAPAESFDYSFRTYYDTFSYINVALQNYNLNRGVWKSLENKEREYSKVCPIEVFIKLEFSDKYTNYGTRIPKGFYKTINKCGVVDIYYFPNSPTTGKLIDYKINK